MLMVEDNAGRKLGGLKVLNSYWVNEDSTYKYYEGCPQCNPQRHKDELDLQSVHNHRELGGLTSAGKKCRGLNIKGHLHRKLQRSRRANWKRNNMVSLPRYRIECTDFASLCLVLGIGREKLSSVAIGKLALDYLSYECLNKLVFAPSISSCYW
ncbi:hypothetical protein DVH24_024565 [Malus domestica]|uniref:Ribosomal protein L15 n=1 Tax=Malus domestica TaxID=3750 RepID=A0A498JNH3_MALDO|nr:hypothetical protein DVH24_024565 [Malus domestica]